MYALEFHDIQYSVPGTGKEKKVILNGISGRFRPGYLSAVLGPSGAGKTSLLNILSGKKVRAYQGTVTVNGVEQNPQAFRQLSCYITQEFSMFPVMTVEETLDVAIHIKLGLNKKHDRSAMIKKLTKILGLVNSLNTRVSNLSGGEKKRLSIGLELVTNPPIMFFDEPTSGLDSISSLQVVQHLRSLAEGGRTIVIVIHQPSSRLLELIDDLFIIMDGQCLYNGPLEKLVPTFSNFGMDCPQYYNRADFALEVACRERGDHVDELAALAAKQHKDRLGQFYEDKPRLQNDTDKQNNEQNDEAETEKNAMLKKNGDVCVSVKLNGDDNHSMKFNRKNRSRDGYSISKFSQFSILFKRCILCNFRDFKLACLRIAAHVIVAIILGIVYFDFGNDGAKVSSNFSCIFFMIIFLFYGTALHTVMTYPTESAVIIREHFNNWYPLSVYYIAKTVSEIPLLLFCPTAFLSLAYYMTGQPMEWTRFLMFLLIAVSLTAIAQSIGCIIGVAFETQLAIFLTATGTMPMFLISGFFIHLTDLAPYIRWLSHISIFKYSLEGSAVALYGLNRTSLRCYQPYCHFKSPRKFLNDMGMEHADYWRDATVLIAVVFFVQTFLYYVLRCKMSSKTKK